MHYSYSRRTSMANIAIPKVCGIRSVAVSSMIFYILALAFPPLKRLAFSTHAAVSLFSIFRVPVLGGFRFPIGPSLKKTRPAAVSIFLLQLMGAGYWVGSIDRSVGWAIY